MSRKKTGGNRTDLLSKPQPVRVATGQAYGAATASTQAQQAAPLPQAQVPPDQLALAAAQATPPPQQPIHAPTARPGEPITAGLPVGPGPGPEVLARSPSVDATLLGTLRGLYQANPNSDLSKLIATLELRGPA